MAERQYLYLKTAAPTVDDDTGDGYLVGDVWLDETNGNIYQAIDVSSGAAVWPYLSGSNSGTSVLSSAFSITASAGTFEDTGVSVSLPAAGTYMMFANVRIALQGNAGTAWWISAELYDSTAGAAVADSERMIGYINSNTIILQQTGTISMPVTVTEASTIKIYVTRNGAGSPSWTTSVISSDANGRTALSYMRIA